MENIFRIELNIFGVLISALVIILFYQQIKKRKIEEKIFILVTYNIILELVLDSLFWIIDGTKMPYGREWNLIINFFYYFFQMSGCFLWSIYVSLHMQMKMNKCRIFVVSIFSLLGIFLLFANIKTGCVFTVSESNVYHRTWGLWGSLEAFSCLFYAIYSCVLTTYYMIKGNTQKRQDGKYLFMVSLVPIISTVFQLLFYGLNFIWAGMSLAILLIFAKVEVKRYRKMEQDLSEQKIQIMLSQIQPHFLYNVLSTIRELCKQNPDMAGKAIEDFSNYLRGNMDSIKTKSLVPFSKELEHVKTYLSLEKLRFGSLLDIKYDLQLQNFYLPVLTLQPIVENAVKHGVGNKEEGGTVFIRTYEEENRIILEVQDDGEGFDTVDFDGEGFDGGHVQELPMKTDGKSHVGLKNVRKRIEDMVLGELQISSRAGSGTKVRIIIPKER